MLEIICGVVRRDWDCWGSRDMVEDKDVYSLMESLTPINFNSAEAFLLYSAIDFFIII